ncbi:uncharacterized protein LOC126739765 [Anthonomus grandis grandis]|uniref:uncharacterized protein LOC126739765 n=1 Tax=Anthonomus grandis grandis TaxID=2921223 RepID=UPI002165299D|nr:uncharacterized protein LOC126739765 [Anthonomus grandis grandis]
MTKFWELEEIPSAPLISGDDQRAELIFRQTVKRTSTGRFMVSLPFKESEPDLGNTYPQALRRFLLLESRLMKNPELYNSYSDFINEYIHHEYMTLIPFNLPKPNISCYLPHHCVLKPDSISTKLRVVWDASAKGPKGLSLNDTLLPGPKLQNDLSSLLLIFRLYPIVFIADIRRMFLQILITPEHRKFQRILWRFSAKDPIREYELNTVTFGVSSSPFLAIRTLNELAEREKENFPNASRILKQNTYIDDVLGFSPSISSALDLQRELIDLLKSGGFQLAKWASNCPELLAAVPESDRQMSLSFDKEQPNFIKVLGLQWHPKSDIFTYQYKPHESECTKRTILQVIGRIFDPLGLLCPILLLAKYIMQQLWLLKIDWDDTPPEPLVKLWTELKSELPLLSEFKLPRQISLANRSCDIIAICDASNKGYAAVVYFRVEGGNQISVSLVCARSRVAPISNRQTLARLELLGAVLLSNLVSFVIHTSSTHITINNIYAYTDSQIVLAWLNSPPERWQTFVGNRVNHIQKIIPSSSWYYIPSAINSADCASRGLTASKLIYHDLWWKGPAFLWHPKSSWPDSVRDLPKKDFSAVNMEEKRKVFTTTVENHTLDLLINKFSSLPKIQRILSYCLRVKTNFKKNTTKLYKNPSPDEMWKSYSVLIKHVQTSSFPDLISKLNKDVPIPKPYRKLSPFIDKEGMLRVGGRLQNSDLPYSAKHPLLLPKVHPFTNLVIEYTHNQHLHPGLKTLHHLLLQQFWIISAKHVIQKLLSKCLLCFRTKPKPYQPPPMGNLPFHRINQLKPFSHIAIDFCGPFYVTPYRYRGAKVFKSYVCVFVCTIYKIIHLELTTTLSTEGFVSAFRRFISRRGTVTDCWSDQGSNFIGFKNQLVEFSKEASEKLLIRWHLGPPLSPHFNALAESGVKSFKSHFLRVVGDQKLTIEEMSTLICQIEAILNSRPLTAQSTDPNDLLPLTPFHFLTLEPLNSGIPDPDLSHLNINRLSRWQLIQKLHADFWKRFSFEYLNTLQQRHKWSNPSTPIKLNALVLIQSDLKSPLKWPLGRVIELHPGEDGQIRVATVKTSVGNFKRPVIKLCPLPEN